MDQHVAPCGEIPNDLNRHFLRIGAKAVFVSDVETHDIVDGDGRIGAVQFEDDKTTHRHRLAHRGVHRARLPGDLSPGSDESRFVNGQPPVIDSGGRVNVFEEWESESDLAAHLEGQPYLNMAGYLQKVGIREAVTCKYRVDQTEPVYDLHGHPRADFFTPPNRRD